MIAKLWLMAAVAIVIGRGVAYAALAGGDGNHHATTRQPALTASQKAARKRLAATADYLEKHNLSCGCRHHFPAPNDTAKP
jgi:hypothetical protein